MTNWTCPVWTNWKNEYNAEAAALQSQIDALEVENAELVKQIASSTVEDAGILAAAIQPQ